MSLTDDLTVTERLRRLVFSLVGLMVVALLAGTLAVVGAYRQVDRLATLLGPANDASTSLLQTLTDAETGLRAYDASSNTALLQPFIGAQKRSAAQQEALRTALGPDLPQWSGRLKAHDDAITAWWAYANASRARLAGQGNLDLLTGKQLFDEVRRTNGQIGRDLQTQRLEARAASTGELRTALLLLVGGTLLASVLALWAGWRIARSLSGSIEALRHVVHLQRLGDRDVRADEHEGPLDVRGLAADFNHLTETTRTLEDDQREALRMREVTLGLATRLRGRVAAQEALAHHGQHAGRGDRHDSSDLHDSDLRS